LRETQAIDRHIDYHTFFFERPAGTKRFEGKIAWVLGEIERKNSISRHFLRSRNQENENIVSQQR
jgi:hypothetical protein